jgi:hypothetical protein
MFKTIRLVIYIAIPLIITVLSFFVYKAYFGDKQNIIKIENTAIVIEEVEKISQLFSSVYYDELVIDTFKVVKKTPGERLLDAMSLMQPGTIGAKGENILNFQRLNLVVIARGRVFTGYDFSKLETADLVIDGRSIIFNLPPAEVLEVVINPSDYEIFIEEGRWSLEETLLLKQKAAKMMTDRAIELGILEQSEEMAIKLLQNFFKALGFEDITIGSKLENNTEPEIKIPAPTQERS